MSYRVDIPTLSANEVYTLTFEYEGTETIQLIVGDLTLETTDRRVVFTTTSPVNYIESNMNLTNLNVYEGYYESDDFGGEYTQESYIEGKSLINYKRRVDYGTLINNAEIQETFTDDGYVNYKQLSTGATGRGFRGNGFAKNIDQSKNYTIILRVRKNTFPADVFVPFTLCHKDCGVKFDGTVKGSHWGISYNISGRQTGVWKAVVIGSRYNVSAKDRYWGNIHSFLVDENSEVTDLTQRTDIVGCEIEYAIEVLQGDYFDIDTGIDGHFEGIGCVKSPRVKSLSPENLYVSPLKYRKPLRGYEYYHNDGTVEIYPNGSGAYSTIDLYTGEDVGMAYLGSPKTWYVNNGIKLGLGAGTYYFHCEIELIANKQITDFTGKPIIDVSYDNAQYFGLSGNYKETFDGEKYHYKGIFGVANKTVTDDIRGVYVGIWSYGISGVEKYVIRNITLTREESLKDTCAISKSSMITTPDDLELYCNHHYDKNAKKSFPCYQDTLDLTAGTITRNNMKIRLNDYMDSLSGFRIRNHDNLTNHIQITFDHYHGHNNIFPSTPSGEAIFTSATGLMSTASQGDYEGWWFPVDGLTQAFCNDTYMVLQVPKTLLDGVDTSNVSALKECLVQQDFTLIMKCQPYTEQLSINPLKSYRNGSIQTSSQQLTPTLKTTLPVSNKFTQTNLSSGQTYNIYFDGTATKLDAGGTIITDPVSPCEVECGGTTLTIEGTDIQNVRVLETTNKNEVGSVVGTTDVELSGVKCIGGGIPNLLSTLSTDWENGTDYGVCIRYKYGIDVEPNEKYVFTVSNIGSLTYKEIAIWNTDKWVSNTESIITTQRLTPNTPYILTVPSGVTKVYIYFPYDRTGNLNQAHEYELRMQEGTVDLGYGGQKEATIPLVCNLEQPIKLRSLGTTYDSYNPVTGELTKRIGVSETDGSYSVLSSPVVGKLEKSCSFMGNLATSDQLLVYNGATKNGDVITLNKVNRWSLVQLAGSCTRMEKGKQYMCILHDIVGDMTGVVFVRQQDTATEFLPMENNRVIFTAMSNASNRWCYIQQNEGIPNGGTVSFKVSIIEYFEGAEKLDIPYFNTYEQRDLTLQLLPPTCPHLYTNGQVKVYSDSDVYPTTILNGQSTNNYEVNELNKSNNYTIRYDGTCESINLANKSNEQGTNRIVKTSTNGSGNLTFVNDNGDIDNVLLVQNDVREQEINHFNGLQTVEVSRMLIQNQRNMFCYKDISVPDGGYIMSVTPIPVQPSETLYCVVYNSVRYSSLIEYDSDMKQLRNTEINVGYGDNGNAVKLTENTYYVKVVTGASFENKVMISREGFLPLELGENIYQGAYIDLPQPVQLNSLPDGTCDTYNPITGEYVQNVGYFVLDDTFASRWRVLGSNNHSMSFAQRDLGTQEPHYLTLTRDYGFPTGSLYDYNQGTKAIANVPIVYQMDSNTNVPIPSIYCDTYFGNHYMRIKLPFIPTDLDKYNYSNTQVNDWLRENPIHIVYKRTEPITTQLTPITIPTFEGGILQLITTDGKVFPMVEYSMPTNNRYDTSSWETGAVYTQRNMTEAYFNESTTPMTPTETMTLTTDHISSGSIILNDNGNGLIVLKGNYTGRDIPYFTGMRSVEAIEVETTPSPDQPLFGKGGRK